MMLDEDQQTLINFNKDTLLLPSTSTKISRIFNLTQTKILNRKLQKVPHKGCKTEEEEEFVQNVGKFMKNYSCKDLNQEDYNLMKSIIP
jgi:beta-lactamase superfamily II metal-dependent hydrolase